MKQCSDVAIFAISLYQAIISPLLHYVGIGGCRYTVSCSEYAKRSIRKYGIVTGSLLALKRLSTCHPFSGHHSEPGFAE